MCTEKDVQRLFAFQISDFYTFLKFPLLYNTNAIYYGILSSYIYGYIGCVDSLLYRKIALMRACCSSTVTTWEDVFDGPSATEDRLEE